jgi:hypothetical protein
MTFQANDPVIIIARAQTEEDVKNRMYYPHYANMAGRIL